MSDIATARLLIKSVVDRIKATHPDEAAFLRAAVGLMFREKPAKPRAASRRTCTPEKAEAIRAYLAAYPTDAIQDVAVVFGTNAGRVSEAIHGKR